MTSRFRDTAFLEESSCGACLEVRWKSRLSFLPALRSCDSLLFQPSSRSTFELDFFFLDFGSDKLDWAFARAPKEMDVAGAEMSSSDS